MIKVAFDQSPLSSGHAVRGIGNYTRQLAAALVQTGQVELLPLTNIADADLIHFPTFDLFTPTLRQRKVKPTVVTIHDVIPLLFPEFYPVGIKGKLNLTRQIVSLKSVSAVITDSRASQTDIEKYLQVPREKISVVYLAGNPELVPQSQAKVKEVKQTYHLPDEYLLYVGDINYNKNVPQLIKALKYLPDSVELVCVGTNFHPHPIPEWQAIETQLALSDVTNRVHFVTDLKSQQTEDLAACYSGAVAYVQPSLSEGFGLPVLEALQCECPVVVAHNSSLLEVGGETAVWVDPEAESIAKGVKEVLAWDKTTREAKVKQGMAWSQTFSWSKTALETISIYQSVLGTTHG